MLEVCVVDYHIPTTYCTTDQYFDTFTNHANEDHYWNIPVKDSLSNKTFSIESYESHNNKKQSKILFEIGGNGISLSNQRHFKTILGDRIVTKNAHRNRRYMYHVLRPREKSFHDLVGIQEGNCFLFDRIQERSYSFAKWPPTAKIWPIELAKAGFFSLGDDLKLQCSFCGIRTDVREWDVNTKPLDKHAELNPQCEYLNSFGDFSSSRLNESKNSVECKTDDQKSLSKYDQTCLSYHEDSHELWKSKQREGDCDVSKTFLQPPQGFVFKYESYSSYEVRLKTFDKWKFGEKQNPRNLSESGYFYTGEGDIVRCFCCDLGLAEWDESDDPWTEHARHSPRCWFLLRTKGKDFVEKIQLAWRKIYNPKHAAYDDKLSRMATFEGVWRSDIEQTPEILADAGFFYEGEEDVVRCHYCDGGLRNWEPKDVPWEEHARWFPFCKFVIKMKGREYIDEIKAKYETAIQEPNTETSLSNGALVNSILEMGFQMKDIMYAANEYTKDKGNTHYNAEDLLNILIERHEAEKLKQQFEGLSIDENQKEEDPEKVREVNKELKKNMMCIRCEKNTKSILFVECGHRVTCETCANDVDFCPYCDVKIKTRLKTYLS
ncbi:XIAP [Mytilus coruscus]|uniref:XIAP n=1 Tax=Mytilus coruscus TaxID=42192 RepID=A0A6J8BGS0_MYTCO|nr:XIAP [Mytilus coruscus]